MCVSAGRPAELGLRPCLAHQAERHFLLKVTNGKGTRKTLAIHVCLRRPALIQVCYCVKPCSPAHFLQVTSQQEHIKLNAATAERLSASASEVAAAAARVAAADGASQRLSDRLRRRELDLEEARRREAALKDRANELRAFVDALTVYAGKGELAAAEAKREEEAAAARSAAADTDAGGGPASQQQQQRLRELEGAEAAAREQLELMGMEADALRAQVSARETGWSMPHGLFTNRAAAIDCNGP
eukprot:363771-Chlamydomonas_euryale.AAC.7